ncbi:MAG TPA: ASKHA domain-containing protein [Methanospirillum sp.]|uniref:ASKHA domain-containing protein n=1 Tax=Methanospirillum sp. TaxID=45200 RepID=UPI002B6852D8|nr:ASKHA domain-containing protein [Methanospirillum sp.]HWQ63271.1 ASKHA domain-containing protein [Methanospirillum sp.]
MPIVTFLPGFRKVEVSTSDSLMTAAQKAGLAINAVCGGVGKCGKCVMFHKSGRIRFDTERFREFFSQEERDAGAILSCEAYPEDDCQIMVPERTLIQTQQILMNVMGQETLLNPSIRKYYVQVQPPTLATPTSDLYRLLDAISNLDGPTSKQVYVPLEILRVIPSMLRDSGWKVTATIARLPAGFRMIEIEKGDTSSQLYGAAVDLGTTTVVAFLRDLNTGQVIGVGSAYNKQISCGEDILSRVNYSKRKGLVRLQELAVDSINAAITMAANNAGVDRDDICEVVIAGNTIMTHMLLAIDPSYMIEEPYVPVVRRSLTASAGRVGLSIKPEGSVFIFPAVSDFIGGDIVADIVASGMAESPDISLLIDIGTNFEVVLGNNEWMFACAGAAGPALEGGEVLFGMRANPGAIEKVSIDPITLDLKCETINGKKPVGICGSGLIDVLAELLRSCVIDRTGRINTTISHPRIRQGEYFPEFVLAWKDETGIGKDIVVTENDIKNLIMSKASTLAACIILMNQAGITREDIKNLYFAGGFGNYINKDNAITVGLIPEVPVDRIINLGNGAAEGANIALINRKMRKFVDDIAYRIGYVELNAEPTFMDEYTKGTFLPHTDLTLFPMVEKSLELCRLRVEAK